MAVLLKFAKFADTKYVYCHICREDGKAKASAVLRKIKSLIRMKDVVKS